MWAYWNADGDWDGTSSTGDELHLHVPHGMGYWEAEKWLTRGVTI